VINIIRTNPIPIGYDHLINPHVVVFPSMAPQGYLHPAAVARVADTPPEGAVSAGEKIGGRKRIDPGRSEGDSGIRGENCDFRFFAIIAHVPGGKRGAAEINLPSTAPRASMKSLCRRVDIPQAA
jgi:hypothetical protein